MRYTAREKYVSRSVFKTYTRRIRRGARNTYTTPYRQRIHVVIVTYVKEIHTARARSEYGCKYVPIQPYTLKIRVSNAPLHYTSRYVEILQNTLRYVLYLKLEKGTRGNIGVIHSDTYHILTIYNTIRIRSEGRRVTHKLHVRVTHHIHAEYVEYTLRYVYYQKLSQI